jgi:hypothetical protein
VSVRAGQPVPHRAVLAPVFETRVVSSRYPDVSYPVSLLGDGTWTCACRGYGYGARSDGECRHIDTGREERGRLMTLAFLLCEP